MTTFFINRNVWLCQSLSTCPACGGDISIPISVFQFFDYVGIVGSSSQKLESVLADLVNIFCLVYGCCQAATGGAL